MKKEMEERGKLRTDVEAVRVIVILMVVSVVVVCARKRGMDGRERKVRGD